MNGPQNVHQLHNILQMFLRLLIINNHRDMPQHLKNKISPFLEFETLDRMRRPQPIKKKMFTFISPKSSPSPLCCKEFDIECEKCSFDIIAKLRKCASRVSFG